jgi:hypothetical protein
MGDAAGNRVFCSHHYNVSKNANTTEHSVSMRKPTANEELNYEAMEMMLNIPGINLVKPTAEQLERRREMEQSDDPKLSTLATFLKKIDVNAAQKAAEKADGGNDDKTKADVECDDGEQTIAKPATQPSKQQYACDHCGGAAQKKCSRCKAAFFCNQDCNVGGWKEHKPKCDAVAAHIKQERRHKKLIKKERGSIVLLFEDLADFAGRKAVIAAAKAAASGAGDEEKAASAAAEKKLARALLAVAAAKEDLKAVSS